MEELLCALLDCFSLDLLVLKNVGYDLGEIVKQLQSEGLQPSLNMITSEIFWKGQQELTEAVKEKLQEKKQEQESLLEETDCSECAEQYNQLQEEIEKLESLNPEDDMSWFCNKLDTLCWFSNNGEIYREYLADEIKGIEDNMGFTFLFRCNIREWYYSFCYQVIVSKPSFSGYCIWYAYYKFLLL